MSEQYIEEEDDDMNEVIEVNESEEEPHQSDEEPDLQS